MCRNIKILFNFAPSATDDEIRAAALQYVRKVSGYSNPTGRNENVFNEAVADISLVTKKLLTHLETTAKPKNREIEAEKAKERARKRFGEK